jgi:uncharacterized membrane protein
MRDYVFPPLLLPFFLLLILFPFFLLIFFFATSQVFQIVFDLDRGQAMAVFFLIIIGSLINIPLVEKEGRDVVREYNFFGIIYHVRQRQKIVLAVNLGGCVFPSILAFKLLPELPPMSWLLAFVITSAVIYHYAKPVRGVGIAIPMFLPPLVSVLIGYSVLSIFGHPMILLPKFTFSIGVLAVLFGADILHLREIEKIGSGVVSIGGAGTFDGIFLTGVFAVIFSMLIL